MKKAAVYEQDIVIPTYRTGPMEKDPLFIEKRAYQGSTGKVYPLPICEKISEKKEDVSYRAVILENEYLYVMILPELGGRIQRALDKTNGYDFVYYNRVIKPALVGLAGPWISGGIEFNWPQHHRPSTFMPVNYMLSENPDGSATVTLGETDRINGTRSNARITLHPDRAYIEIRGQLFNPTDFPQTFLWWANPAVSVNDDTFSVFPPDVNAVMDHGKRAVSTFPIATGEYYKADYSAGIDISRYKNIRVPTSYMAAHSDFDFVGNFDEGKDAGLLHVADHHISPGKKQWTWGCGNFGKVWDQNLTDEDGPYIELMTGVFCDNQPDFSWLKPREEKNFVQYFMPYKTVGRVSNATKDVILGVDYVDEAGEPLTQSPFAFGKAANLELADRAALGRIGTAEETARAICWLAEDEAAFVTGQVLGGTLHISRYWLLIPLALIQVLVLLTNHRWLQRDVVYPQFDLVKTPDRHSAVCLTAFAVTAVRSFIGYAIPISWKKELWQSFFLFGMMGLGKALGGYLADRFGARRVGVVSTLLCIPFLLFGKELMLVSVFGVFCFSLTMSITFGMLLSVIRESPGSAFGVTTAALFAGLLPVFLFGSFGYLANGILIVLLSLGSAYALNRTLK